MSTATGLHYRTANKWEPTPRQREVLNLIARGYTNAQIGEALGMSLDGAKFHVSEIIGKLGVSNREEAAEWWANYNSPTNRLRRSFSFVAAASFWKVAAVGAGLAVTGVAVSVAILSLKDGGSETDNSPAAPAIEEPAAVLSPGAFSAQVDGDIWELELRSDGTFFMSAGTSARFEGSYELAGDRLTVDDRASSACDGDPAPADYQWTQDSDSLTVTAMGDTCTARSRFWARTWHVRQ